jgi:hypothetical protein
MVHFGKVGHPSSSKWRLAKVNGSLSDSDSAFYASDASDNRHSADSNVQVRRYVDIQMSTFTKFITPIPPW